MPNDNASEDVWKTEAVANMNNFLNKCQSNPSTIMWRCLEGNFDGQGWFIS